MLNHLFATILICLGVANTTPISNYERKESNLVLTTPKKANANYSLTLQRRVISTNNYIHTEQANYGNSFINKIKDYEKIGALTGNNNYINVIGNVYTTIITNNQDEQTQANSFLNYDKVLNDDNYNYEWVHQIGYLIKITSYNFNIDTSMELYNTINIERYSFEQITNLYLKKTVYNISIGEIDQYIGLTTTQQHCAYNIEQEITNVNNGYYYTKNVNVVDLQATSINRQYIDRTQLNLLPNQDNYFYILYTPMIQSPDYPNTQPPVILATGNIDISGNPDITGTNIIPDGTYEVVDIPGLMFEVIGMPFAFVSQAFNLTLFPGTPYQINIANLFLSIAAIFVFVWLLLLFIKMKG